MKGLSLILLGVGGTCLSSLSSATSTIEFKSGMGLIGSKDASVTVSGFHSGALGEGDVFVPADWALSNPYIVRTLSPWPNISGSTAQWIAPDFNTADTWGWGPGGEYVYEIEFIVDETPKSAWIDILYSADDLCTFQVNGQGTGALGAFYSGITHQQTDISSFLKQGENKLSFYVMNLPGINFTGLIYDAKITYETGEPSVPGPSAALPVLVSFAALLRRRMKAR